MHTSIVRSTVLSTHCEMCLMNQTADSCMVQTFANRIPGVYLGLVRTVSSHSRCSMMRTVYKQASSTATLPGCMHSGGWAVTPAVTYKNPPLLLLTRSSPCCSNARGIRVVHAILPACTHAHASTPSSQHGLLMCPHACVHDSQRCGAASQSGTHSLSRENQHETILVCVCGLGAQDR
jgi:hypothetical protein